MGMTGMFIAFLAGILGLAAIFYFDRQRRRAARAAYGQKLEAALADGILTAEEAAELDELRVQEALTPAEVHVAALTAYRRALQEAIADQQLTPDEDVMLARLQRQLNLREADIAADLGHLNRLRLLARAATGTLPQVESPLALARNETCHWVVRATVADRLDLPGGSRVGPGGVLEVRGDAPFSVGAGRGSLRPSEDVLPTDLGILIATDRRTIFRGARHTLTIPHARLERITVYEDGLCLDAVGSSPFRYLLLEDADLVAAILLHAARRHRSQSGPPRSGSQH